MTTVAAAPATRGRPGDRLRVVAGGDRDETARPSRPRESESTLFSAPRGLKEPVFWKLSHFR